MEVSETRLGAAIIAVFGLGILFSILNGYYMQDTGEPIPLMVYGMSAASMGVGALIILLFQWRISQSQLVRILRVLPEDERIILEVLVKEKKIDQTHLVAEPKVTWHVLDCYKGPISVLGNDFARMLLDDQLGHRSGLKAGATVAHLAFYLAVYMGCDPIVLVGQDLGYTGNVYYMPGVAFQDMWMPDLNRFSTIEMKEWERIVRHRNLLKKVEYQPKIIKNLWQM